MRHIRNATKTYRLIFITAHRNGSHVFRFHVFTPFTGLSLGCPRPAVRELGIVHYCHPPQQHHHHHHRPIPDTTPDRTPLLGHRLSDIISYHGTIRNTSHHSLHLSLTHSTKSPKNTDASRPALPYSAPLMLPRAVHCDLISSPAQRPSASAS